MSVKHLLTYLADDYWNRQARTKVRRSMGPRLPIKMINEGLKDYEADPSGFVPFKRRKKG
jgi:hypothetical protein